MTLNDTPIAKTISLLWIVVMINMAFADILSFMYPDMLNQMSTGTVEGITITPAFLLIAAVLIEIPALMIALSRLLPRRLNRMANLIAVALTILFVIGGGSLKPHYILFASIEVAAMLWIGVLAWRWNANELRDGQPA